MKKIFTRSKALRTAGNSAYVLGIALLLASLVVNAVPASPAFAIGNGGGSDCAAENTDGDNEFCESLDGQSGSWNAPGGYIITGFVIKAGTDDFGAVAGCYEVNQSDTSVSWNRIGDGPDCKEISHVEVYYKWTPPPATNTPVNTSTTTNTPTKTPTNTPVTSTSTPTHTLTHTPTNTPTDTSTPTITNTPTSTSTGTIIPTNTPTTTDTPTNTPSKTPTNTLTNTPTSTSFEDPFDLAFFCMGFRIININNFESAYAWSINGGPSGTGTLPAFGSVDIYTDYYPGIVTLYAGQELMASGLLPTDCGKNENTPTPLATTSGIPHSTDTPPGRNPTAIVKTLIPDPNPTPEILIPMTGVDLAGGTSVQSMLFNLGVGLLGLGLVLNGLSRPRKDMDL